MEQLRTDLTPQKKLFTPQNMPIFKNSFANPHDQKKLDVDHGDCREKTRLSLELRDVRGTVYDRLGWASLLRALRKSANRIVR